MSKEIEHKLAEQLFGGGQAPERTGVVEAIKEAVLAVAPGLKDAIPEAMAELGRLGTQGTMELASALFNGSAFVPYGPGQYTPTPEHGLEDKGLEGGAHKDEQEQERHQGRSM